MMTQPKKQVTLSHTRPLPDERLSMIPRADEFGKAVRVRLYAAYGPCAAHSSRVRVGRSHPSYARSLS